MKQSELDRLVSDNCDKATGAKLGKKLLREVAALLPLAEGSFDLRFNAGGPAVSGEVTLHGEHVYIQFSLDALHLGILVRACAGRKDYSGGSNHWYSTTRLGFKGPQGLADFARAISTPFKLV